MSLYTVIQGLQGDRLLLVAPTKLSDIAYQARTIFVPVKNKYFVRSRNLFFSPASSHPAAAWADSHRFPIFRAIWSFSRNITPSVAHLYRSADTVRVAGLLLYCGNSMNPLFFCFAVTSVVHLSVVIEDVVGVVVVLRRRGDLVYLTVRRHHCWSHNGTRFHLCVRGVCSSAPSTTNRREKHIDGAHTKIHVNHHHARPRGATVGGAERERGAGYQKSACSWHQLCLSCEARQTAQRRLGRFFSPYMSAGRFL